jgi:hypothetical protein
MGGRKLFAIILLSLVFYCGPISSVHAWEFGLEAAFHWNWYSAWQMGHNGFFGPYDFDASTQNLQNANFWGGADYWDGVFPHAHVSTNTMTMEFSPEFTINEAVKIRGAYYLGSWNGVSADPAGSEYLNSSSPGTLVSFSPGYWNQLWASAETPWGIVALGKRPFVFGLGGHASGEDCATTESLALVAPYGPLRLGFSIYVARRPADLSVDLLNSDAARAGLWDPDAGEGSVFLQDENGAVLRSPSFAGFLTYRCGPADMGFYWEYIRWSVGAESLIAQDGLSDANRLQARINFIPYDFYLNNLILYLRYVNGRIFFNAEAHVMDSMTRRHRPNNPGGTYFGETSVTRVVGAGSLFQTGHILAKRFYAEAGALFGPVKCTGLFAWVDGYDRRHGVLIDKQGTGLWLGRPHLLGVEGLASWSNAAPNGIIFYPYSFLLVYNYGGGNNHFNVQGDGYLVDAVACAAKIDYAVAANLNLWGSFFYADRLSKGYGWGFIRPDGEGNVTYQRQGRFNIPAPAIPESNLGWEIDFGVDWELLDGLLLTAKGAYWQPGDWFKYACRSKTNPNWDTGGSGNNWGIDPNRTIDPVMGMEIVLGYSF